MVEIGKNENGIIIHEIIPRDELETYLSKGYSEIIFEDNEIEIDYLHKEFYDYQFEDGHIVRKTILVKDIEKIENLINKLKDNLSETDYMLTKNIEYSNKGLPLPYDNSVLYDKRNPIRRKIRELEILLNDKEDEVNINSVREEKITQLLLHDSSSNVNTCYISYNNQILPYWANKTERSTLKTAINDCISAGREYYRLDLRDLNVSISIKCSEILMMLTQLEVYAIDCYNVTTDHLIKIKGFETIEEIEAYDFTLGYPEKLTFTINNDIEG